QALHGADVDDGTALLAYHEGEDGTREALRTHERHAKTFFPFGIRRGSRPVPFSDEGGVVAQNVDPARYFGGKFHDARDLFGGRDVATDKDSVAAGGADGGGRFRACFTIHVGDEDRGTGFGECFADGFADTVSAPGDDGDLVFETWHGAFLLAQRRRPWLHFLPRKIRRHVRDRFQVCQRLAFVADGCAR